MCVSSQWYDLYGVLVHIGHTVHTGHYYCFVRAGNNAWHKCDDTQVGVCGERQALAQSAYLLFYIRRDPKSQAPHSAPTSPGAPVQGPPQRAEAAEREVLERAVQQKMRNHVKQQRDAAAGAEGAGPAQQPTRHQDSRQRTAGPQDASPSQPSASPSPFQSPKPATDTHADADG